MAKAYGRLGAFLDNRRAKIAPRGSRRRLLGTAGRLVSLYALVTSVVLGLSVYQVIHNFSDHSIKVAMLDLGEEVPEFATAAGTRPAGEPLFKFSESYLRSHGTVSSHHLVIALEQHPILVSSGSSWLLGFKDVKAFLKSPPTATHFVNTSVVGQGPILLLVSPIIQNHKTEGLLFAEGGLTNLDQQRRQVLLLSSFEALVALVFSVLSSYYLLRRVMRTVGEITEAAVEIYEGDIDRRIIDSGDDDEVGGLVDAFNRMIGRISDTLYSQRRLLADVSHQLRTPLTVMRGNVELLQRSSSGSEDVSETAAVLLEEIEYMSSMVERLLMLERSTEQDFLMIDPIDLRSFLLDLFASAQMLGPRNWRMGTIPDLVFYGDSQKLRGAVLNLLENAVKATEDGALVELSAEADGARWVTISVEDEGKGIDPSLQEKIFTRFDRGESRDSRGAGLGLAIVKAIVEAHGGTVVLRSSPGVGAKFSLILPVTPLLELDDDGDDDGEIIAGSDVSLSADTKEDGQADAHSRGRG